jgi:alpha-tubulin suppressor-like RCC1 family protein
LSNVVAVAGGAAHSLALRNDGTVVAWGSYNNGGRPVRMTVPGGLGNLVGIASGDSHALALRSDGTVVGWGNNDYGQRSVPPGLSNVVAVAGGGYQSLALRSDGTVVAWPWAAPGTWEAWWPWRLAEVQPGIAQ